MNTKTMTIHEALSELKMLDKRIQMKIGRATFVTTNKHSNAKISGKPVKSYMDDMLSELNSIRDLIEYRAAVKNALSISNAKTVVTIAGREYTVAEAIEMKSTGIENEQYLLNTIAAQFTKANREITQANGEQLRKMADDYINNIFGSKDKATSIEDIEQARKVYIDNHTMDLIDPCGAAFLIDDLEKKIEAFKAEVDAKISISNATTTITINW